MTVNGATSSVGVARTAAANQANRERYAIKLAADLAPRLRDLPKVEFATLAFLVVDEIERRAAERRAGAA